MKKYFIARQSNNEIMLFKEVKDKVLYDEFVFVSEDYYYEAMSFETNEEAKQYIEDNLFYSDVTTLLMNI